LPRLFKPFSKKVNKDFYKCAEKNKYDFMRPFYFFVGDYDHKYRIPDNLKVRFYEDITLYWATQLNDLFLIIFILFSGIYYLFNTTSIYRIGNPFNITTIIIYIAFVLFLINRYLMNIIRNKVKTATSDQIKYIHNNFKKALEDQFRMLCKDFKW
jgi:hypothetical protein